MDRFKLTSRIMTSFFWDCLLEDFLFKRDTHKEFLASLKNLEILTNQASIKTGSISNISALILYYLTCYFKPQHVLEVGTFIGKSTYSLAKGMEDNNTQAGYLCTCDKSNEITIPWKGKVKIKQYKKKSSSEMLKSENKVFDFIFLDGRLDLEDLEDLDRITNENSIVIFDDFEGMEKGVINLTLIKKIKKFQKTILIYPPPINFLKKINPFSESCNIAVLLPIKMIEVINRG